MWETRTVFFVHKKNVDPDFKGYASTKGKIVGMIRGGSYHDSFWKVFPYQDKEKKKLNSFLSPAKNTEQNLKMLAVGRIDLAILDRTVGQVTLRKLGLQDKITFYDIPLYSKGYPMPFARKSAYPGIADIAKNFDAELAAMKKNGEYQAILARWLK